LLIDEPNRDLGTLELPARPSSHVWALPDNGEGAALFQPGLATLGDYGYLAKTGYFVWNREQHRYRIGKKAAPDRKFRSFGLTMCAPMRSVTRG